MGRFIQGSDCFLYIATLPLCKRTMPVDQTIAVAAAASGATSLTATTALTSDLAAYSSLAVVDANTGENRLVYTTNDALAGATAIPIAGLNFDIAAGNATYTAKQFIANLTESGFDLTSNSEEFYFLNNQTSGFKDSTTVTGEWNFSVDAKLQQETAAHIILVNASIDAINRDRECFAWFEYPLSDCTQALGFTNNTAKTGVVCVMEYNESVPGDNIVTVTATLDGRGAVSLTNFYDN